MTVDSSLVDRIVRGVLHGLQGASRGAAPAPIPTASSPGRPAPNASASGMKLPQPVITAEVVSQIPGGATQLVISPRAVVTPAALDLVRSRKLTIRRETPAPTGSPAPAARRLAIVVSGSPVLDRVLLDRTSGWRRELLGCPDDAATLAIRELSRGEVDAVLIFTSKPFRAACRANRNAQVRAVAVSGIEDLKAAVGELRVNAACVDPTGRGDFEIRRWLRTADELLRPRGAAG